MTEQDVGQVRDQVAVHRVETSVDWPPGNVAAYFVECEEPILVDAIMTGDDAREDMVATLADAGYDLADVEHVVITHPHVDHIGQVPAVLEAADPEVYAPAGIETRFARDADRLEATVEENARAAGLRGEYLERAVEMSVDSLERDSELLPPERVDHWVEGGETVTAGPVTFETVHTPGHQADHLCYLTDVNGERVIFSGDMALSTFRPVAMHVGFDDGYEEAIDAYYTGLDRLAELSVDRVFTGHDPVNIDFQGSVAESRESLDRLLDRTLECLSTDTPRTAVDVAFEREGDRDIRYLVIETTSALAKLAADEEINAGTDDDGVVRFTLPA
jgi:glyoxylase-like metal-dependent hydrolase (beta-lactamase superfamily II)